MLKQSTAVWTAVVIAAATLGASARAEPAAIPDTCRSKTDGCQVCSLDGGKVIACSLPGIACAKGEWHCNEPASVPPLPEAPSGPPSAPAEAAPKPANEPAPAPAP